MKFPWDKYEEIPLDRRNTLQVFITNRCNMSCNGCFARNIISENNKDISLEEYREVLEKFIDKGGEQINLLGGEPLIHPEINNILRCNYYYKIKTTVYTNGYFLDKLPYLNITGNILKNTKFRVSIYSYDGECKSCFSISENHPEFDANFMVSSETTLDELLLSAERCESFYKCKVFFISSIRELDNERKEFFDDTELTMPVLKYKELVHNFLDKYNGDMEIHISKRGVFESTVSLCGNKCKFANYFIGGKIIQCPYDVVNRKFQPDYEFDKRYCQQNSSCLMSKIKLRIKK